MPTKATKNTFIEKSLVPLLPKEMINFNQQGVSGMPEVNDKNLALFHFLDKINNELSHAEQAYYQYDPVLCSSCIRTVREAQRLLEVLRFITVEELETVKNLVRLEQFFSSSYVLSDMAFSAYRSLIDPELLSHAEISVQLDTLEIKSRELDRRGHHWAAVEAKNLVLDLRNLNNWYFNEKRLDYVHYKTKAFQAINESRLVLEQHRGYKKILGNLVLLILTLGIAFIINKACTGHFLFFKQTDSAKQINVLSQKVMSI